jgi:hypothetical protein
MKTCGLLLVGILFFCGVAPIEDYTRQMNRTLIENSFRQTRFVRNFSDAAFDRLADFPDSMTCSP